METVGVAVGAAMLGASVALLVVALCAAAGRRTPRIDLAPPPPPDEPSVGEIAALDVTIRELKELEDTIARASAARVVVALHSGDTVERADVRNLAGAVLGTWDEPDDGLTQYSLPHAGLPHRPDRGAAIEPHKHAVSAAR